MNFILNSETLTQLNQLGEILARRKLNLTCAESCTGGGLAYLLTSVAGSSRWFKQAWVTYSLATKIKELNIDATCIETHGVVSNETAEAMAKGALLQAGSDLALSTTGIAGPGGAEPNRPVGTVYFGFAIRLSTGIKTFSWRQEFTGGRLEIREAAILEAFRYLYETIVIQSISAKSSFI